MAWTQTDLDRIDRVIAAGELTVRFADGKMVTYRSMADLQRAKAAIKAEIDAAANGGQPVRRTIFATFGRD